MVRRWLLGVGLTGAMLAIASPALAQKIIVKSAAPASGEQGSIGLEVAIGGSGFGPGAEARFVLSGTATPPVSTCGQPAT